MSTTRTRKENPEDHDAIPAVGEAFPIPDLPHEYRDEAPAWVQTLTGRLDALILESAEQRQLLESALLSRPAQEDSPVHAHVQRRRSLDEMQAALRRLLTPEPRPKDDDSAQVLTDAITELILQRQLVSDLMQAATSSYQRGLAAIRRMTER